MKSSLCLQVLENSNYEGRIYVKQKRIDAIDINTSECAVSVARAGQHDCSACTCVV